MGFMDTVKGLFQSDLVQGALESTPIGGLGEQLGTQLEDVTAGAEAIGADVGQVAEVVPGADALPTDLGSAVDGIGQIGPDAPPAP